MMNSFIAMTRRLGLPVLAVVVSAPTFAQTASEPVQLARTVSPLAQIPGVTVQYYDVTGATIKDMRASVEAQRPKDPVTGQAMPSSAKWSIGTNLKKQTTGTTCKITAANATFKGEVVLPRLVTVVDAEGNPLPKAVTAEWQRYVTSLEQQQADLLRQIHNRLPEVEKAVLASDCEGAGEAANRAISAIRQSLVPVASAPTG